MFDLEKALSAWRRSLAHNAAFLPEDRDELERHVRDQVAALARRGASEREAFERAMAEMGGYGVVETEYEKVYWGKRRRRREVLDELGWRASMLANYVKVALRNLRRQKGYAFINVTGLAVGLACSFFILLWVQDERRVDRFFPEGERIYRVWRNVEVDGQVHTLYPTPRPLGEVLATAYPEIEAVANTAWDQTMIVTYGDQSFREAANYAGADFFRVFPFAFVSGDPATALQGTSTVVVTDRLARRLFGDGWQARTDVLGTRLTIDHARDYTLSGVVQDPPEDASLQFDVLLPIEDFFQRNDWTQFWTANAFPLYVRLKEGASPEAVNAKIADVVRQHREEAREVLFLQPYEDLYLYSDYRDGRLVGGRIVYVRIFTAVAVFILLIAAINFMNLATARSGQRAREVGVRKAVGATRKALAGQFVTESLLMAFVAFAGALVLIVALLPAFNSLTGKHIDAGVLGGGFLPAVLGITLVVGLVAGSYPAFYLSSFDPLVVLRGAFRSRAGASVLRKGLVVFQFALTVLLLVGTVTVFQQLHHIRNQNLGLRREGLVFLPLEGPAKDQYDAFRQALLDVPGVAAVSSSNMNPLQMGGVTTDPVWEGKAPDDDRLFYVMETNYDFVETMGMELVAGRTFSKVFGADSLNFVVNEETAKVLGGGDVVGKPLEVWGRRGHVVGVVKNFSMNSIYAPVAPTIFQLTPGYTDRLFVRLEAARVQEALAGLEAVHERFNAGYPFTYTFLDQDFEDTYRGEATVGRLTNVFAGIAVFISCLGLFGLVSFTAEQRTKEIGVRKVLGASVPHLVLLLTGDFTKLVLAGVVVALPAAYFAATAWLDRFASHVEPGPGLFVLAGALAVAFAWLTVAYQALRAAFADPVKSLRYE